MPDVSNLIKRFILPAFIATTAIHFPVQANTVRILGPEEDQPTSVVTERYRDISQPVAEVSRYQGSYQYGPTRANETLWGISSKYRPSSSVSVYQVIGAIYRANPQAFEANNIHGLIPGSRLDMPTLTQIRRENTDAVKLQLEQDKTSQPARRATSTAARSNTAATTTPRANATTSSRTTTESATTAPTRTANTTQSQPTVAATTVEPISASTLAETETLIPPKPNKAPPTALQDQLDASDIQITKLLESNHLLRVRLSEMQHEVAALQDQQTSDGILRDEIKDFLAQQKTIEMQPVVEEPSLLDQLIANPWALAAAAFIPGALIAGVVSYFLFGRRKEEDEDDVKSLDSPNSADPAITPPNDGLLAGAADPDAELALSDSDDIDDLFAQDDALFDDPEDSLFAPQLSDDDDTLDLSSSDDFDIDGPLGGASSISVTGDEKALGLEDMERALDEMDQSSELSSDEALAAMWEQSLKEDDEQPNFDLSDGDDNSNDELLDNGMLDQSLLDELLLEAEQADSSSATKQDDSNEVVAQSELDALFDSFDSGDDFDSPEQAVSDELAEQAAIDAALAEASAMADPESALSSEAKAASVFSEADTQQAQPMPASPQSEQDLIDDIFATSFAEDSSVDSDDDSERLLDESSTALLDELIDDEDDDLGDTSDITLDENSTALLDELLGDDEQDSELFSRDIEIDENSTALLDELLGDEDESLDDEMNSFDRDLDVDDISNDEINIDELIIDENSTELLDELLGDTIESSSSEVTSAEPSSLESESESEFEPTSLASETPSHEMSAMDIDDILAQQGLAPVDSASVISEIADSEAADIAVPDLDTVDAPEPELALPEQEQPQSEQQQLQPQLDVATDDLDALLEAYSPQVEINESVYDEPEFEAPAIEAQEPLKAESEKAAATEQEDADFAPDFNDILTDALTPVVEPERDPFESDETAPVTAEDDVVFDDDIEQNTAHDLALGDDVNLEHDDTLSEPDNIANAAEELAADNADLDSAEPRHSLDESTQDSDDHHYDEIVAEVEGLLDDTPQQSSPIGRRVDELLEEMEHAEAAQHDHVQPENTAFSLDDFPEFTEDDALSDPEASEYVEPDAPQSTDYQASDVIRDDELPEFDEHAALFDPEAEALEPELEDVADEQQSALDNVVKQLQQAVEASEAKHDVAQQDALDTQPEAIESESDVLATPEQETASHAAESENFNLAKTEPDFEFETIDLNSVPEFSEDDARQASFDEQHELEQYDIEQGLSANALVDSAVESQGSAHDQAAPLASNKIDQQLVDSAGLDMDALLTDPDAFLDADNDTAAPSHSAAPDIDLTAFDEPSEAVAHSETLTDEIPIGLDDIESQERDQLLFNDDPFLDDQSLEMSEDDAAVWAAASEEPRLVSEDWSEQPQMQVEEVDRFDAESLLDDADEQELLLDASDDSLEERAPSPQAESAAGNHSPYQSEGSREPEAEYHEADSELLDEAKPSPASYISIDELLKESDLDDIDLDIDLDSAPLNLDVGLDEFPDILAGVPDYDVDSQGEYASKLDLAKAYLEMNDAEGAADLLQDIAQNGDAQSAQEAANLLKTAR
ncbi:FimV/HubP family polar landmark protein [Photobacterium kagoshimensis]|uniref:FimV/HubP family polar landmark protein n=1 Tax=Photobacterium kagoshimensis TaxID=2910242 RepID=UPI003D103058